MSVGQALNLWRAGPAPALSGNHRRGKATPEEVDLVRENVGCTEISSEGRPDSSRAALAVAGCRRADEVRQPVAGCREAGRSQVILEPWRNSGRGPCSEAIPSRGLFVRPGPSRLCAADGFGAGFFGGAETSCMEEFCFGAD